MKKCILTGSVILASLHVPAHAMLAARLGASIVTGRNAASLYYNNLYEQPESNTARNSLLQMNQPTHLQSLLPKLNKNVVPSTATRTTPYSLGLHHVPSGYAQQNRFGIFASIADQPRVLDNFVSSQRCLSSNASSSGKIELTNILEKMNSYASRNAPWAILEVQSNALAEEIVKARRTLLARYHPDRAHNDAEKKLATQISALINRAADEMLQPKMSKEESIEQIEKLVKDQKEFDKLSGKDFVLLIQAALCQKNHKAAKILLDAPGARKKLNSYKAYYLFRFMTYLISKNII